MEIRNFVIVLILGLSVFPLFACGQQEPVSAGEKISIGEKAFKQIVVTDSLGREIVFEKPAEKVITLMPSANEAMKLLDAWDKVIARDHWTTNAYYYPSLEKIPTITSGAETSIDFEKIIEMNPDLFFISLNPGMDPRPVIERLSPEINVVVLDVGDAESLGDNMKILGKILGKEKEAEAFANFNDGIYAMINERTKDLKDGQKPRVFIKAEGYTVEQLCTITDQYPLAVSLVTKTGGINIASKLPGVWIQDVDQEWLIEENPEVILVPTWNGLVPGIWGMDMTATDTAASFQNQIMSMDVFKDSDAVKNSRVYLCNSKMVLSPSAAVSMLQIAAWFHPDLFSDINPREYYVQYINDFLNVNIDLTKQGVFAFPAE